MRSPRSVLVGCAAGAGLATALLAVPTSAAAAGPAMPARPVPGASASAWGTTECFGLLPITGADSYQKGCYGHDEPEIDPVSNVPGTGQDISWTIQLPTSSAKRAMLDLGPTFWIGGSLTDPSSVGQEAFTELQFYPDSKLLPQKGSNLNTACSPLGFNVAPDAGTYSVCDFTWGLYGSAPANWQETAAYVKVLDVKNTKQPMYLHSGDVIRVHIFNSHDAKNEAEQVVTDVTTGQSGEMIFDSNATTGAGSAANPGVGDGPLTLPDSTNSTDHPLPWGAVADTPFAFSWEIGHSNFYTHPTQPECVPGQWDCWSYNTTSAGWGAIKPLQIMSASFDVGGKQITPSSWATADGQGGTAEDALWCGSYNPPGTSMCSFPWYTYNPGSNSILFGTNYPGTPTKYQWGEAPKQYTQSQTCPGPLTKAYGFLYFCDTTLNPTPPIP